MNKNKKNKGISIIFSFGKYGGFYFYRRWATRICFGWFAITFIPEDIDDTFERLISHRRKKK